MPLTVKELIEALQILNPDATIEFEYDGPEPYTYRVAAGFIIADDNSSITLVEERNLPD